MAPSLFFSLSLVASVGIIFWPALLADPSDASCIGFFGEDYEGNLCGQYAVQADGSLGRDLRARPFAYWLNSSTIVCVRICPRLADELVCEYPLESLPISAQRAHLGERCFAQQRTRTAFPACLPHTAAAAAPVDRWLSRHVLDQLAADMLHASPVILGCWVAAGLASLVCLSGLIFAPRLLLFVTMLAALAIALLGAVLLLPHGARSLAAAREPLGRNEATYWREELPGVFQFALGWAACAGVALLVLTLCSHARRAPVAAALLSTAARPLLAIRSLLVLPLYLYIAVGAPLVSWITSTVYLATPCNAPGSLASTVARLVWPLTLCAPYWLAAAVTAWVHCAIGGGVGRWYTALAPDKLHTERPPSWPLWRSGWLALDAHFSSIGAAAALLPLASTVRMLIPPVSAPPRRSADPYRRCILGCLRGTLRCAGTLTRPIHPGGLVYLARQPPIGAALPATSAAALPAAKTAKSGAGGEWEEADWQTGAGATSTLALTFLEGGERCAQLFSAGEIRSDPTAPPPQASSLTGLDWTGLDWAGLG